MNNIEENFWTISEDDKTEYCKDSKNKFSEYIIEKFLGSGSFGMTYLAKKLDDDKLYVLKKLTIRNPSSSSKYGVKLEDIHSEIAMLRSISESEMGCVKDLLCYVDHFIDCSNPDNILMNIVTEAFTDGIGLDKFINRNVLDVPGILDDQIEDLKSQLDQLDEDLDEFKVEIQDDPDKKQKYRNYIIEYESKKKRLNAIIERKELQIEENTRYTPLSHNVLLKIMHNILKAIYHLHRINIGHGDLKPENILINPTTYDVQIIDFGASCKSDDKTLLKCTTTGTLQYDSPEIIKNILSGGKLVAIDAIKSADMFSLGAIFYRLANGRHYFSYKIEDEFKNKNIERAMLMINEMYDDNTKIFSMYNENRHPIDERINNFIESLLVKQDIRSNAKESLDNLEKIIEEYNLLINERRRKKELKIKLSPYSLTDDSPVKYTPGILTPQTPKETPQTPKETEQKGGRAKLPRKWSKAYCKKTSCDKMGFSQRASCRPFKNCYK